MGNILKIGWGASRRGGGFASWGIRFKGITRGLRLKVGEVHASKRKGIRFLCCGVFSFPFLLAQGFLLLDGRRIFSFFYSLISSFITRVPFLFCRFFPHLLPSSPTLLLLSKSCLIGRVMSCLTNFFSPKAVWPIFLLGSKIHIFIFV